MQPKVELILLTWNIKAIAFVGFPRPDKSSKSCLRKKHIEANGCLFLRHYQSCGDSNVKPTENRKTQCRGETLFNMTIWALSHLFKQRNLWPYSPDLAHNDFLIPALQKQIRWSTIISGWCLSNVRLNGIEKVPRKLAQMYGPSWIIFWKTIKPISTINICFLAFGQTCI